MLTRLQRGMDPLFGEQNMLTRLQRGMDPLFGEQNMLTRLQRGMDRNFTFVWVLYDPDLPCIDDILSC